MNKLEKTFHEPNRLAVMSALCGAPDGLAFTALKTECDLTDGNLNRHLKVLKEAGAVIINKSFVAGKPRTTVRVSARGRKAFVDYLTALEEVLRTAEERIKRGNPAVRKGVRSRGRPGIQPT